MIVNSNLFILLCKDMWFLLRPILHILSYALSLYLLDTYTNLWWIDFVFTVNSLQDVVKVYLFLWVVFRFCFAILKRILKIFAFPLQILTLWLIGIVINILTFYICAVVINTYVQWVTMNIQSLPSLFILSLILSGLVTCIYRLLKKII